MFPLRDLNDNDYSAWTETKSNTVARGTMVMVSHASGRIVRSDYQLIRVIAYLALSSP
jgi:hypothetical protein